jgi:hypothetical protein
VIETLRHVKTPGGANSNGVIESIDAEEARNLFAKMGAKEKLLSLASVLVYK